MLLTRDTLGIHLRITMAHNLQTLPLPLRQRNGRAPLTHAVARPETLSASTSKYQCSSIESMEAQMRDYLANPTAPAEHAVLEFYFPTSAAFMVFSGEFQGTKEAYKAKAGHYPNLGRTAISVVDALSPMEPKEQLRKQKAIAKALVDSMSNVDGYRYSFHNNWISKEDEACRFSYYCNDSTLNKGRAANEGAGMVGKKKVKPVYDCNGVIHIKFSVTKQSLEVLYKHIPVHQTYEERAPPPRKNSKRRKFLELFAPDKLPKPGEKKRKLKEPKEPKPRKKRRATEPPPGTADAVATAVANGDDSLAPLMDFLGSAEKEGEATTNGDDGAPSSSDPPIFPASKLDALKKSRPKAPRRASSTPRQGRARPSNIPGTMSGYLVGNELEIQWTYEKDKPAQREPNPTEPLQGIAAAAAEVAEEQPPPPAEPKSELDLLKEKLLEAEQRIQRLESEKQKPPMGPPGWPPPAPPPPSQGYGYPYPPYGYQQPGPPPGNYPPPPAPQQYQYPLPHGHQQGQRPPSQGHNVTPHHVDQDRRESGRMQPTPEASKTKFKA